MNMLLPSAISSIDKFAFQEQQKYCFAQTYFATSHAARNFFGQFFHASHGQNDCGSYVSFDELVPAKQQELSLLDLISPDVDSMRSTGHHLYMMIYLERGLLQDTRTRSTSHAAVLFAFDYLIRMTKSFHNGFIHSMACVHLAVLGMQYFMHDRAEWLFTVREIINNDDVTDEPVINACHAYFALSTSVPDLLMKPELARASELGQFSASTPIASILSLTNGSVSATLNGVDIVVAQSSEWKLCSGKAQPTSRGLALLVT